MISDSVDLDSRLGLEENELGHGLGLATMGLGYNSNLT